MAFGMLRPLKSLVSSWLTLGMGLRLTGILGLSCCYDNHLRS
jgi:hypothetical protein